MRTARLQLLPHGHFQHTVSGLWQPDAGKPNNEATKLAEKPHSSSTLQQDVDYHACVHDLATSSTLAGTLPVDILSK